MRCFSRSHLSDAVLIRNLDARFTNQLTNGAELLADLGEVDVRKLHVPAGYSSLVEYCQDRYGVSEDAALNRIRAARAAYAFPALLPAVEDGRLDLTALLLLAPHLTVANVDGLITAAARQTKAVIKQLLGQRLIGELKSESVDEPASDSDDSLALNPAESGQDLADLVVSKRPNVSSEPVPTTSNPLPVYMAIPAATHEKLKCAQSLLSHSIPSGDLTQVLDRALEIAIGQLKKVKHAATSKPRKNARPSANPRHVPAAVRRAVHERDGGQCTFVGDTGHRCASRTRLEFDHIVPVARGGEATVANVRLRCRAHNQYEAERVFGAGFMQEKRARARRTGAKSPAPVDEPEATHHAGAPDHRADVYGGLRELGFRRDEARRAADFTRTLPDATLEECMRAALKSLGRGRVICESTQTLSRPGEICEIAGGGQAASMP